MFLIHVAYAQQHITVAQGFLEKLNKAVLFPLITLMMAVALLVFLYGAFEYVKNSSSEQGRETGRRHLMWGIVGMLVMLSAYAILTIAAGTFSLNNELNKATTAPADNRAPSGTTGGGAPPSGSTGGGAPPSGSTGGGAPVIGP